MRSQSPTGISRRPAVTPIILAVVVLAVGAWVLMNKLTAIPCAIVINGEPVVTVESVQRAKSVLGEVRKEKASGVPADSVRIDQDVTLRTLKKGIDMADFPEAVRKVADLVTVGADLYAVNVDGEAIVAFADKRDADESLDLTKKYYESKLPKYDFKSTFKESVFVEKRHVPLGKLRSNAKEGLDMLISTVEKPTVHTIKVGDRVIKLSAKYHVSMEDLKKMNRGVDLNRLHEGDSLVIKPARTPVTVVSKAIVDKTETVAPPTMERYYRQQMNTGKRQMQVLMTYENAVPVSEVTLSQITTWNRPKTPTPGGESQDESGSYNRSQYRYRYHRYRHYHRPAGSSQTQPTDTGSSDTDF